MRDHGQDRNQGRRAALISACAVALAACSPARDGPLTGYVEGEYIRIAAPFAGTLQQLSVRRGAQVAAGAPLFALERENETAARREAVERLAAAEARLANLRTGKRPPEIEAVVEQLQQARAARELSAANLKRQQQLFASKFVSAAVVDDAQAQLKRDEAHVAELTAAVATTKMPARTDEIRAAEADAPSPRRPRASSTTRITRWAISFRRAPPWRACCRPAT